MNPGAWFDQILSIFSSPNLQLFLLVGSGILAISLLVLALTRWGHSRPVWKCVVLSFAAHILLMGFAYGTRMIVETPQVTQEDNPMRVNLIPETGQSTTGEDSADASENTWDQFVNQQALPNVEDLERPSIDSEVVIEKVVDRSVAKPDTESPATDLDQFPQKQEFTEPEFAQAPKQINNDFPMAQPQIAPQQIEVKRLGDPTAPLRDTPTFEPPQEMARQEISNDFAPQTTPNSEQNPMAPSQKQTPFTSDLVDVNSQLPKAPVTPPTTFKSPDFKTAPPVNGVSSTKRLKIVANPRRIGDGQPLPKIYSLRKAQNRLNVARRRGGSVETERAVESALQWLANNQEADGSWDPQKSGGGNETKVFGHDRNGAGAQAQCGITGLASLSFLAAGHSHLEGGYQQEVQKALEYLVRQQRSNGDLSGNAKMFARMYCHSMSLLALSEAFAMTGDSRLFEAVQRGVNYTVSAQNRSDGGWRYQPGDPGDMSQFGWQVLAYGKVFGIVRERSRWRTGFLPAEPGSEHNDDCRSTFVSILFEQECSTNDRHGSDSPNRNRATDSDTRQSLLLVLRYSCDVSRRRK